ncbi:MAG TPA: hypothetical protein VFC78_00360, partial [Tepidisphaeraceae bacterium]|nr:hypothetical protein [Tepidisphaeraceae bacterium]
MKDFWVIEYSWLIPLLPLIGAAIAGLFGARWLKGLSHWPIWIGVGISAILSFLLLGRTISAVNHAPAPEHAAMTGDADSWQTGAKDDADGGNGVSATRILFNWIEAGDPDNAGHARGKHPQTIQGNPFAYFRAEAGFFFDPLTVTMLCVVCGIGFLIAVFSAGYMKGEEGYFRFFAYLGLFIFMMTCLVMGSNLLMLYLG